MSTKPYVKVIGKQKTITQIDLDVRGDKLKRFLEIVEMYDEERRFHHRRSEEYWTIFTGEIYGRIQYAFKEEEKEIGDIEMLAESILVLYQACELFLPDVWKENELTVIYNT